MININKEKILQLKEEKKTFVVQFSANWCSPCKSLTPILEGVCSNLEVDVYKFDISKDPEYSKELGITSIPFVKFFKEGEEVASSVGLKPQDYYKENVQVIKG